MREPTSEEFLKDLKTGRKIKIKIMSLGENIGLDFGFFCHFYSLKKVFPNVELHMIRANLAECNNIGFGQWKSFVKLPLDSMKEVLVRQWYRDGNHWLYHITNGNFDIIKIEDRTIAGFDYYWGINCGDGNDWTRQYPKDFPLLRCSTVEDALIKYDIENPNIFNKTEPLKNLPEYISSIKKGWNRTTCESLCINDENYPWEWINKTSNFNDYLHIGLRWPDCTRWYYSIEDQKDLIRKVIKNIKDNKKQVNIIYNLKDMQLDCNFNRGQNIEWLKEIKELSNNIIFTYSWNPIGMPNRATLREELSKLSQVGIVKTKQVTIWEEMKMSYDSKVYIAEPAGMTEAIFMARANKGSSTFSFPLVSKHNGLLIGIDRNNNIIKIKANNSVFKTLFNCDAIFSNPEDPGGHRLLGWKVSDGYETEIMPENYPGGDYEWFQSLLNGLYLRFAERSKPLLIDAITEEYCK